MTLSGSLAVGVGTEPHPLAGIVGLTAAAFLMFLTTELLDEPLDPHATSRRLPASSAVLPTVQRNFAPWHFKGVKTALSPDPDQHKAPWSPKASRRLLSDQYRVKSSGESA